MVALDVQNAFNSVLQGRDNTKIKSQGNDLLVFLLK